MFKTEVDISVLSANATIRWKRDKLQETDRYLAKADHRRVHSLISTNNPSNFLNVSLNPSDDYAKVSKQEDIREVSVQLGFLRKKHDLNCDSNLRHGTDIVRLKRVIDNFNQEEEKTISKLDSLKGRVEELEGCTEEIKKKQEEALAAANVYKHILERMKKSRMQLDIRNEEFINSIKANIKTLNEEFEIARRIKESKIKTKKALQLLGTYKEKSTKEKQERLDSMKKDVLQRQENNQKREERYKRQLEIAEAAANEDRDMRATQIRESLMSHRFWYLYLEKRLSRDMEKFSSTEDAFKKVRKIAGISDASEMVTKFLTSELAYNDLKRTVDDSTNRIEETQEKIVEVELKIQNMEKYKIQTGTIESLHKDVVNKLKVISRDKERLMKLKGIYDKIYSWTKKNLNRFSDTSNFQSLVDHLTKIKTHAKGSLAKIKSMVRDMQNQNSKVDFFLKGRIDQIINDIGPDNYKKIEDCEVSGKKGYD